jgi:hypothetical protein
MQHALTCTLYEGAVSSLQQRNDRRQSLRIREMLQEAAMRGKVCNDGGSRFLYLCVYRGTGDYACMQNVVSTPEGGRCFLMPNETLERDGMPLYVC